MCKKKQNVSLNTDYTYFNVFKQFSKDIINSQLIFDY